MFVPIAVVFAALALAVLLFGILLVLNLQWQWIGNKIPVVGPNIVSYLDDLSNYLQQHVQGWFVPLVAALADPLWAIQVLAERVVHALVTTNTAQNTRIVQIPNEVTNTISTQYIAPLQTELQNAEQRLDLETSRAKSAEGSIYQTVAANHTETQHWVDNLSQGTDQALRYLTGQLQSQGTKLDANHAESKAWVDGLATNVQAFQAYAQNQLQAQATSIVNVEAEARGWVDQEGVRDRNYADLAAGLAVVQAGAAATAYTDAAVGAVETAFTDYLDTCGLPMCDGLLNTAKAVSLLRAFLTTGALLVLIEQGITNPEGTAKTLTGITSSIAGPFVSEIRNLAH